MNNLQLKDLLELFDAKEIIGELDNNIQIRGITKDSREVQDSYLFCAIGNDIIDGHTFIKHAEDNGAAVIIAEQKPKNSTFKIPLILVEDSADAFSRISAYFYKYPAKKLNIIGVTGTNGKTTCTYIIEKIFKEHSLSPGVIGTVNYRFADKLLKAINTTPQANHYHSLLKEMQTEGISHAISEISSHGLTLKRVWNLDIDTAIFTNLTQDHLDFHKDFEAYYEAKKSLFTELLQNSSKETKNALINTDDKYGSRLFKELHEIPARTYKLHSFSIKNTKADFHVESMNLNLDSSKFTISHKGRKLELLSKLIGYHNISNLLASIAVSIIYEIPFQTIASAVEKLENIPGRLDRAGLNSGKYIFIDYAHTPDALDNVLEALRKISDGKPIITVFGCGGDRDRSKRPLMGRIAAQKSNKIIVTSDNPRTEDPESIIEQIISGFQNLTVDYIKEVDRAKAIKTALDISHDGDILLIAGKGHEDYQIHGTEKIHFCDKEVVNGLTNFS